MHVHTCKINGGKDLIRDYLDELSLAESVEGYFILEELENRSHRFALLIEFYFGSNELATRPITADDNPQDACRWPPPSARLNSSFFFHNRIHFRLSWRRQTRMRTNNVLW